MFTLWGGVGRETEVGFLKTMSLAQPSYFVTFANIKAALDGQSHEISLVQDTFF